MNPDVAIDAIVGFCARPARWWRPARAAAIADRPGEA